MKTKHVNTRDNLFYTVFYNLFKTSFLYLYKKVTIVGRENLPKGESYLITPNHQNTMMDAMAILFTTKSPHPFFLARADIFQGTVKGFILSFLKMLPIFRIRDGKDSLQNNEAILQKTTNVIGQGVPLTIYPEGNHFGQRRFRSVKKGVIRTSFLALENLPKGKKLYIVPTGIEYNTSYEKAMQNLVVFYGKPICVNDFWDLYLEDKARGERQLQLALFDRMSDQMIDIKIDEYYDFYDIARECACGELMLKKGVKRHPGDKLVSQIEIVKGLDRALEYDAAPFAGLQDKAREYKTKMKDAKLRDWLFDKPSYSGTRLFLEIFAAILLSPIALYGRLTTGLQFIFINYKANKTKDPQWRSSMRFILGFTLLPFSHLAIASVTYFFNDSFWVYFAAVGSLVLSSNFSLYYEVWLKKIAGRIRYNKLRKTQNSLFVQIESLRNEINAFVLGNL